MPSVILFTLSTVPPSTNAQKAAVLVKGKARLIKTKEYRQWIDQSLFELLDQKGFEGDFIWRSDIRFPCNTSKLDVDNAVKACHDILVKAGKVPDDRYLADTRIRWAGGEEILIYVQRENLDEWLKVKKMSKALIKKLS